MYKSYIDTICYKSMTPRFISSLKTSLLTSKPTAILISLPQCLRTLSNKKPPKSNT